MGFALCPGGWCRARVCTSCPQQPFLRTWLGAVYLFLISLCPGGCLLSWLLGLLLWRLSSRLCCERDQVGELMPPVL